MRLELLGEARPHPGWLQAALNLAIDEASLLEHEDVLEDDDVAFHALDLGDVGDLARAVLEPLLVDDQVDGRRDLLADRAQRQLDAGEEHHRLESGEHVARGVGVAGRHRAVVAGVHCLEHVQSFAASALADDDAIGPHAEGVTYQFPDGDGALALDVGGSRLERYDVLLAELELGRILDGDDALVVGDERRQHVEHRGLA